MQLKKPRRLRRNLLLASCALLGSQAPARADAGDWSFDAAVLYYSETDRVTAVEPVLNIRIGLVDEDYLNLKFVADALSGASPNGAMNSTLPQVFTRTSGNAGYTVPAGAYPLDPSFTDSRYAANLTWSHVIDRLWRLNLGANASTEHDYQSVGANIVLARDLNKRNTTLSAGLSVESDSIEPIGGVPDPLAAMPPPRAGAGEGGEGEGEDEFEGSRGGSGESKTVIDALLGVTQVISRTWIAQLNYAYSVANGYQTDPYKLVSILNTAPGQPLGLPVETIYEKRPDSRHKQAVYLGNKIYLGGDVLDLSYRRAWDDWGIDSDTWELRYRWALAGGYYLEPHLRYYQQTAADFYRRGLLDTDPLPAAVSADYRLAAFTGRTAGLEFGKRFSGGNELSARLEYYEQSGGSDPHVDIGIQQAFELFPKLKATIVQVSYSF